MFEVTRSERTEIRKDWADALADSMLDEQYGELKGKDLALWQARDPVFLAQFHKDVKEFLETIVEFRQEQAEQLFEDDPKWFAYLEKGFVDFAKYGGTECRLVYRTFFARKGYESFVHWLHSAGFDTAAVMFINDIYAQVNRVKEAAE
jgi:hypothetical protein